MTPDEIREAFRSWRTKHSRIGWKPITSSESRGANSWFGGLPLESTSADWPNCQVCQQAMQFLLQLDLSALPEEFDPPAKDGVLQLFYCGVDDGSCETWAPFSGSHELRRFNDGIPITPPGGIEPLKCSWITAWESFVDSPHPEEHGQNGIDYAYDFHNQKVNVRCSDPPLTFDNLEIGQGVAELISLAESGDKLGGWPFWVQGAEYPDCPECGSQMELLMQIDSEDNLPYMFGDSGCGHITQCRAHPGVLAFGWACG